MPYVNLGLTNQNEVDTTANQSKVMHFQSATLPQLAYRPAGQTMRHNDSRVFENVQSWLQIATGKPLGYLYPWQRHLQVRP